MGGGKKALRQTNDNEQRNPQTFRRPRRNLSDEEYYTNNAIESRQELFLAERLFIFMTSFQF